MRPIFLAMAVAAGMLWLISCDEDPAEKMAREYAQRGGGGSSASSGAATSSTTAGSAGSEKEAGGAARNLPPELAAKMGKGGPAGAKGTPGKPVGKGAQGTDAAAAESKQKVTVNVKEVKAPYPRYEGVGRYDMTFEVSVDPPVDEGVWKITAFDAKGQKVGEQKQFLVMLRVQPKPLIIHDFYCTAMPASVKMELTGEKAVPAPADGGKAGGAGGNNVGKGSQGLGGQAKGGGGGQSGGDSGGSDKGSGDSGGGDEGGDSGGADEGGA